MESTFRGLFFKQLETLTKREPSREALHELLSSASPDLRIEEIEDEAGRDKAYRALKRCIHPDKHLDESQAVTKVFQEVQIFYDQCCKKLKALSRKRKAVSSPAPSNLPRNFHVCMKWRHLRVVHPFPEGRTLDETRIARILAFKCINYRGSIAHGRIPETLFTFDNVRTEKASSVPQVFDRFGGSKEICGMEAIKLELMNNGPVVSTSFTISEGFLRACSNPGAFAPGGEVHPVLIVGWELTQFGEVWLVEGLNNDGASVPVSMGQYGIDECCVAPRSKLDDVPWQKGPYVRIDVSQIPGWRTSERMAMGMSSKQLEELGGCLEEGIHSSIEKNVGFIICDQRKIAHSRRAYLREIRWDKEKKFWKVRVRLSVPKPHYGIDIKY